MRIGVDIRPLQTDHRYRGIGMHISQLLRGFAEVGTDHEYILFANFDAAVLDGLDLDGLNYSVWWLRPSRLRPPFDALADLLPRRGRRLDHRIDVLLVFDPSYGFLAKVPVVCIGYDLIGLIFAEQYQPRLVALRSRGLRHAAGSVLRRWVHDRGLRQLARADRVVAISESTRRDLLHHLPQLDDARVCVVPLAPDPSYVPELDATALQQLGVVQPYILYVGGADFRKNVSALIEAFDAVRDTQPELRLVLVGREFTEERPVIEQAELWRRLEQSPHQAAIIRPGYVSLPQLRALYSAAELLVYPSLYEGFGLPPLEAMACGCPVMAYDNSSLREVVDGAGELIEPGRDLAPYLERLLLDDGRRASLAGAGIAHARSFSWRRTAAETLRILEEAAR
jgi:glycosyltransferase involved in cell wall biosynthesis